MMSEDADVTNPVGHTRLYGSAPSKPELPTPPRPELTVEQVQARRIEVLETKVRRLEEELRGMKPVIEEHDDRLDEKDAQHESVQRLLSSTQSAVVRMEADMARLIDSVTSGQLVIEGRLRRMMQHMGVEK